MGEKKQDSGEWISADTIARTNLTSEMQKGCKACAENGTPCDADNCVTKLRLQEQNNTGAGGGKVNPAKGRHE